MKNNLSIIGGLVIAVVGAFFIASCDTQSADTQVTITPSSATIHSGQAITLTASGGYDYRWSLSDRNLGFLNTSVGPQVVYTATSATGTGSNGNVQVVTVVSFIEGSATSHTTNELSSYNQSATATAEAYITQL